MSNASNIKLVLIGNIDSKQIITEFTGVKNDQMKNDSHSIFSKICSQGNPNYNSRKKIQLNQGWAYFVTYPLNRLYFVVTESSYPERVVWDMIDVIDKENIFLLTTDKGDLNANGKQSLKTIIDKYQDMSKVNRIHEINSDISEIRDDMHNNIKKATDNILNVQELDDKAYKIKLNAESFKTDAKRLERISWWQNCKWTIILVAIVVVLLLIFVLPYVWK